MGRPADPKPFDRLGSGSEFKVLIGQIKGAVASGPQCNKCQVQPLEFSLSSGGHFSGSHILIYAKCDT